jgi:hypothetical protein
MSNDFQEEIAKQSAGKSKEDGKAEFIPLTGAKCGG